MKTAALVVFLLLKYRTKEPISKAEMLEVFSPEYQEDFPAILSQASICLRLVFGLDVIEVDPSKHSYVLNPILGLTWDGMLSNQWGIPKTSLLGLVLGLILLQNGCVLEEEVWETLGFTGVDDGKNTSSMGSPGTPSPTCGCRKATCSAGRLRSVTLPATSSCGDPGPTRKPTSCRSWTFCSRSVATT
ncbi:melanoma-associated antigen 8-like isoform X2 [Canis lupus familiaris]|uniref:melanoma-associated antigen 8-like isoform X1 n=1 Tax=Canis lupus familiaris TaxID=9615 RepID=UPI0015F17576|nr:melanoma-associated antigen 8-like isoform X1 [Canis lupus familiaris]XP_038445117.1 melanoma-associated antigen 8-like isoform X2 [Canis lupus familiaris]